MTTNSIRLYTRVKRVGQVHNFQVSLDDNGSWISYDGRGSFLVDRVFDGPEQSPVNDEISPMMEECIKEGINMTLMVYGQTGSGKTYTMFGPEESVVSLDDNHQSLRGVVTEMIKNMFTIKDDFAPEIEVGIKMSMFEIYQEQLKDLLDPDPKKRLTMFENETDGVVIQNISHHYPTCANDCISAVQRGMVARTVGETMMNKYSSRSHTLVKFDVSLTDLSNNNVTLSELSFVDLAGSEKVVKTKVEGVRMDEAKMINKSLTTLGLVINCLADNAAKGVTRVGHVPFRDSKLTRALKNSLGGNAKTILITTISDDTSSTEESLGTLRFGQRAQLVQNKIVNNKKLSPVELERRLAAMTEENKVLRSQIRALEASRQSSEGQFIDVPKTKEKTYTTPQASPCLPGGTSISPSRSFIIKGDIGPSSLLELYEREKAIKEKEATLKSQHREVEDMVDTIISLQQSLCQREDQIKLLQNTRPKERTELSTPVSAGLESPTISLPGTDEISVDFEFDELKNRAVNSELEAIVVEKDYYKRAYQNLKNRYEMILRALAN
eukprot:GHVH01003585.1.p1 GENE.GHVH01003585.1~~GHVH01003585.1.p1  ORF type:complete len:553 (+),score=79.03 GHVH01003585.1:58-1716(+)